MFPMSLALQALESARLPGARVNRVFWVDASTLRKFKRAKQKLEIALDSVLTDGEAVEVLLALYLHRHETAGISGGTRVEPPSPP